MSTRAQIQFGDSEAMVYKHSDGYPKGVFPSLHELCDKFRKFRGFEPDYLTARYAQLLTNEIDECVKYDAPSTCIGVGIDCDFHGDIEYFYHVNAHFRISTYVPNKKFRDHSTRRNLRLYKLECEWNSKSSASATRGPD